MLELKQIVKDYTAGDTTVRALRGVSLSFRKNEFVAILGPSGCGKTTMLNIIGGLDRYTSGDLLINGKSTTLFKDYDWDAYRNRCVGFIFQNYNLIPHQTILGNVELALTLSGISREERKKRAIEALEKVGLKEQIHKKPNQLSGGQMQRVAIARAIVNDPEIILADEPTGALDSKTSLQIADLLREIAKERLVVMVTHNDKLASEYATRIIRMLDGEITDDTDPYEAEEDSINLQNQAKEAESISTIGMDERMAKAELKRFKKKQDKEKKAQLKRTSMSFITAFNLSIKNLFTKKWRTFMTAFAGSIGIIGIALVLSISNGFTQYIAKMQSDTLSGFPVSIMQLSTDMTSMMNGSMMGGSEKPSLDKFPDDDKLNITDGNGGGMDISKLFHFNAINEDYIEYLNNMDKKLYNEMSFSYSVKMNVLFNHNGVYGTVKTVDNNPMSMVMGNMSSWQELVANDGFMKSQYDVIHGSYPANKNEIAVVVDEYNRISASVLEDMGINIADKENATLSDLIGQEFRVVTNEDWYGAYNESTHKFETNQVNADMYDNGLPIKISGVFRIKQGAPIYLYNTGVLYTSELTDYVIGENLTSDIVRRQLSEKTYDLTTGEKISTAVQGIPILSKEQAHIRVMQNLGGSEIPTDVYIYPKDFDSKNKICDYLDKYNANISSSKDKVMYTDAAAMLTTTMGSIVDTISIVLVAFAAVSLVVSSIMIGIITYISVIERTKEIGVLRSLGARKKDISRVFNAESILVGLAAGLIGVMIAGLLTIPLNIIIRALAGSMIVGNLAVLSPIAGIVLILISTMLTFIAGLIPSTIASRKDPVKALRTE